MLAVVSITTRNYLHRARALMHDVARLLPEAKRIVACVDPIEGCFRPEDEAFDIVEAATLPVPRFRQLAFALNATALCCALKPFVVQHAFALGATRVLYLDNDILLLRRPDALLDALGRHSLALTPHLLDPLPAGAVPSEKTILGYGVFNAGMFAATPAAAPFLAWWAGHTTTPADMQRDAGYDQIWLNFAPALHENTGIVRDRGVNVASWNLATRPLAKNAGGEFLAGDAPLVAFHFSGFDEAQPQYFLSPQIRCSVKPTPALQELTATYARSLAAHGAERCQAWGYGFARFRDGRPITEFQRRYFGTQLWDEAPAGGDPFAPQFATRSGAGVHTVYRYHDFLAGCARRLRRAVHGR